jgi:hypothetical protein
MQIHGKEKAHFGPTALREKISALEAELAQMREGDRRRARGVVARLAPHGEGTASMIPVLALIVTILVAFVAPLVTWAVARQQIAATAREAWMRAVREQAAIILANYGKRPGDPRRTAEIETAKQISYYTMNLLILEREEKSPSPLLSHLNRMWEGDENFPQEFATAIANILVDERATIEADRGIWRGVWSALGRRPVSRQDL